MPRIFARWATNSRTGISRKDALSANEFAGVQSNDAAVLRDRRGTLKGELPNTSEKAETLGDGPLAIYKPSGSKHVGDGQFQRLDVRGRQQTISLWLVPQRAKLDDKLLMPIADWLFRRIRVVLTARKLRPMKFLVIDDHHLIREALRGVLKKLRRDAIVLEASNATQATAAIAEHADINLVLLDLSLPDRDGFLILEQLRQRYPATSVVVLSATQDRANVVKALDLGASGYIPKSAQREVMFSAIQLVLAGGTYIPPQILERDTASMSPTEFVDRKPIEACASQLGLTDRQVEILALLMQGMNNKTICRNLKLAENTVKNHVSAILRAFNVSNRTEVVIAVSKFERGPAPVAKTQNSR